MNRGHSRRAFVAASTALGAGAGLGLRPATSRSQPAEPPAFKTKLLKALILEKPTEDALKKIKDAACS
jgi:hypothetical protein